MSFCKLLPLMFILVIAARAESAEEMLSSCKSVAEAKVSNSHLELPQDFSTGACWGAFGAVQAAITLSLDQNKTALHVCVPEGASRTQLIVIFMDYTRRNPKRYNEDFFYVALGSLWEAFPCKAK